ncbi:MAG: polyprenyl synthetase family protein [Acidobacteriota bacterium]|nr:polyprenyl synthetase family protein [Acidobacteriota bacterium]MDH3524728.1 polyprenyl synthetase family protein [Acidobacteriota bacterium]
MTIEASKATPPPPSGARFVELIGDRLECMEEIFGRSLSSDVPFIEEAGKYIFQGGGKRMRPALVLLSATMLEHDGDEEITYAAVVELIHSATLVHDDIIDHATLRRSKPTVNRIWGNSRTVLLGDWLYTTAMNMALSHGNLDVVRRLCEATLDMTEGELLALDRLGAIDLSREEYFSIIDRKTAGLFAAAASLPALMVPRRPDAVEALAAYGRALGTCFQLVDDLLDFTARERELGKPVLSDLKEGKLTLPLLLALPRIDDARRGWIASVLEDGAFSRVEPDRILELVAAEGTLEETRELARGYADEAQRQLAFFPPSEARDALELAPDFVLHRRH